MYNYTITISAKPIERLSNGFKMHLLHLLITNLNSASSNLNLTDFVDIAHLLQTISSPSINYNDNSSLSTHMNTLGDVEEHVQHVNKSMFSTFFINNFL